MSNHSNHQPATTVHTGGASPVGSGISYAARRQVKFLRAYAQCANITEACKSIGINRENHYAWLRAKNGRYAAAFAKAQERAADVLEDAAIDRAVNGKERPIYQMGRLVGSERQYSDHLMTFLLKGMKPEKYRENINVSGTITHEHTVTIQQALQQGRERIARLSAERGATIIDVPPALNQEQS